MTQATAEAPAGLAGQTISHYKILEKIGAGGMGVVYKAFDTKLNRLVALKFLPPHMRHDPELKRRLSEEARAASALDHPNIVVIYDIDETPGDLFIAMAFHEGVTLREKIARRAAGSRVFADCPPDRVRARQGPRTRHLSSRHQAQQCHCGEGRHRADHRFRPGEVQRRHGDRGRRGAGAHRSTCLPSRRPAKAIDFRTDLWSLGAVLYEMLAGRPPFAGTRSFR